MPSAYQRIKEKRINEQVQQQTMNDHNQHQQQVQMNDSTSFYSNTNNVGMGYGQAPSVGAPYFNPTTSYLTTSYSTPKNTAYASQVQSPFHLSSSTMLFGMNLQAPITLKKKPGYPPVPVPQSPLPFSQTFSQTFSQPVDINPTPYATAPKKPDYAATVGSPYVAPSPLEPLAYQAYVQSPAPSTGRMILKETS